MQPKKTTLDAAPRPCPQCGHPGARLKRMDDYLSLFFIPLIPVRKGEQFLECPRCGPVESQQEDAWQTRRNEALGQCPSCQRPLEPGFSYCPYCGHKL